MSLIPIKDEKGFFKDSDSGAIVNKNNNEYQAYIAQRERLLSDKERLDKVENEISDIKQMLQILIDK